MLKPAQWIDFIKNLKNGYKFIIATLILIIPLSLFCCSEESIEPTANQLIELTNKIRQKFSSKPDFWKLNTQWVIDNQILSEDMVDNDNIINELGKNILIGFGAQGQMLMPGAKSFDVVYEDLNHNECVALSSYHFSEQQILGLLSLTIINETQETRLIWGENGKLLPSKDKAQTICGKKNILIWNFE